MEELGGEEEGETIIRMYCMRKEYIFNKRKNSKKERKRKGKFTFEGQDCYIQF